MSNNSRPAEASVWRTGYFFALVLLVAYWFSLIVIAAVVFPKGSLMFAHLNLSPRDYIPPGDVYVEKTATVTPQATPQPFRTPSATSIVAGPESDYLIKITVSGLNVRSGPGTGYPKIGLLRGGSVVTPIADNGKSGNNVWYEIVLSDGRSGWISGNSSYVEVTPPDLWEKLETGKWEKIPTLPPSSKGIEVFAFKDLSGDGKPDPGEPPISGILTVIGDKSCTTDQSGRCTLGELDNKGLVLMRIQDTNHIFRYILPSASEIRTIDAGLRIYKVNQEILYIPLGIGFLTSPFSCNIEQEKKPYIITYVDHDLRIGYMRDWLGNTNPLDMRDPNIWNDDIPGVYDQHQGTDWTAPLETEIKSMTPGPVIISAGGPKDGFARYVRQVVDIVGEDSVYLITYGHNSKNLVFANPKVVIERGRVIALSGKNGKNGLDTTNPHLHVSIWEIPRDIWRRYHNRPELYDYIMGRGEFEANGRAVVYPNGMSVALDYDPFLNGLFIDGSNPTCSD